jgi:hypothetical protein
MQPLEDQLKLLTAENRALKDELWRLTKRHREELE